MTPAGEPEPDHHPTPRRHSDPESASGPVPDAGPSGQTLIISVWYEYDDPNLLRARLTSEPPLGNERSVYAATPAEVRELVTAWLELVERETNPGRPPGSPA